MNSQPKHKLKQTILLIFVTLVFFSLTIAAFNYIFYLDPFFKRIETAKHNGRVNLHDLTDFKWDKVCLFYGSDLKDPLEELEHFGIKDIPDQYRREIESIRNISDIRLFIFASNSTVVKTIYLNRSGYTVEGSLRSIEKKKTCLGTNAFFGVHQDKFFQIINLTE